MYGQPQPQGVPMLSPQQVAAFLNQPVFPALNLQMGPPHVQLPIQVPQSLGNLYGNILFRAIETCQAYMSNNKLRTLFFNSMAENGYSNPRFAEFMVNLMDLVGMSLAVNVNKDPDSVIKEAAFNYAQFKVAQLVPMYNLQFDRESVESSAEIQHNFQNWVGGLSAQLQQRQSFGQQQQYGGGGYVNNYSPSNVQVPAGSTFGASRFASAPAHQQIQHNNPPASGYSVNPSLGNFRGDPPPAPAPAPAPDIDWRTRRPGAFQEPDVAPPVVVLRSASGTVITSTSRPPETIVKRLGDVQPTSAQHLEPATSPAPTSPAPAPVYEDQRSLAYDPNLFAPNVVLTPQGRTVTQLKEKSMDRELHLGLPHQAPTWVKAPTIQEADQRLNQAQQSEPEGPTFEVVQLQVESLLPATSQDEIWTKTEVAMLKTRESKGKVRVTSAAGLIIKAMQASEALPQMIESMLLKDTLIEAHEIFAEAWKKVVDADVAVLAELNIRLTNRVNRLISKEMMHDEGTATSFVEDLPDQVSFMLQRYGQDAVNTFMSQSLNVLDDALSYVKPRTDFYNEIAKSYYPGLLDDDDDSIYLPFLSEKLLLASVDLTSVELRLEVPQGTSSALLLQAHAPLAFELITELRGLQQYQPRMRLLLRTTDKVIYQIDHGVHNEDAMLVSVVS